jgi:hypothetical protein
MPTSEFEPEIPVSVRVQTHALKPAWPPGGKLRNITSNYVITVSFHTFIRPLFTTKHKFDATR